MRLLRRVLKQMFVVAGVLLAHGADEPVPPVDVRFAELETRGAAQRHTVVVVGERQYYVCWVPDKHDKLAGGEAFDLRVQKGWVVRFNDPSPVVHNSFTQHSLNL